jgi:hypothetical protein
MAERVLGRGGAIALVALTAACGPSYVEVRPTETLAAAERGMAVEVTHLWLTDDVRKRGLADDVDLVVELRVRNDGPKARRMSPGSFSCWMALDARRPSETRALLGGGGGAGPFPGELPDEGSLLAPVSVGPGETSTLWAFFHGYRFEGSDRPRRITLDVPFDDGSVRVVLADPALGDLRWVAQPERTAVTLGLRNVSLVGGRLRATAPSTEIVFSSRRGPVLFDVGLVSTVLVETEGPLRSSTSAFTGSGLTAHLTVPFASWGAPEERRELGVYAGGSASFLVEILTPAAARANQMNMLGPHAYGFFTAEAGLELDLGALRFAASPFPLEPARRMLPSWSLRVGYAQAWADGVTGSGFTTAFRFNF